ncbi:MAG: hypothetical protein TYPL_1660 [Candidatus Tyloplasma litorale]|nr:MAG: hypothetical protein TYPL_1660 [Mycoplasmatales bacterium]
MSKLEKIKELSILFDLYQNILTDIQKNIFIMYFLEDKSLSEIADYQNTSRTSISDSLKKSEQKLLSIEQKLGFAKIRQKLDRLILSLEQKGERKISSQLNSILNK